MKLADLVGLINDALPALATDAARCPSRDRVFGSDICFAFMRLSADASRLEVDRHITWQNLAPMSVAVLGDECIADTVARAAAEHLEVDTVSRHGSASDEATGHGSNAWVDVLSAKLLCVAVPWTGRIHQRSAAMQDEPVDPAIVVVSWRRWPAAERVLLYLEQHYAEPVTLGELARVACVSKFHLVRRFTKTLGITPHRHQLLLRLSRAKAMLREGSCIADAAHGVGFSDQSHMGRSFRVLMGMTPSQYRQSRSSTASPLSPSAGVGTSLLASVRGRREVPRVDLSQSPEAEGAITA